MSSDKAMLSANGSEENLLATDSSLPVPRWPRLLPVSAKSLKALEKKIELLKEYIKTHPGRLDDLVFTLGMRKIHMTHRSYCIVQDGVVDSMEFSPSQKASNTTGSKIAFAFTGQGAQWTNMAASLLSSSADFRDSIAKMDKALGELKEPPTWTLQDLLGDNTSHRLDTSRAEFSQPLCTAVQIAVVDLLRQCGVTPDIVVGHSSGEIAAAYAAGALTPAEAIICAYLRGQAAKRVTRRGRMAAVGMSRKEVTRYLTNGVQLACDNGPTSVTISGDEASILESLEVIKKDDPDRFTKLLSVDIAYHSGELQYILSL